MGALKTVPLVVGLLALGLIAASAVVAPTYGPAHNCNNSEAGACGPCPEGESHAHNDPSGQCATTPGFEAGLFAVAALSALVVVRLRRRRG